MQPILIVARTLHFWSVATLFGGAGFALALRRGRWRPAILRIAAVIAAATGIAWFACVFVSVTGSAGALADAEAWSAFLSAPFGWPWALRLALCAAALLAVPGRAPAISLVVGAGLALDQAWLGHAATGLGLAGAAQIAIYWLHVIGGFAWVGALVALCVLAIEDRRVPADGLALFSSTGIVVVATIAATGIANAALRGVGLADLATSPYGRVLSVKALLFVAMLGLAAYNRLRLRPADASLPVSIALETLLGLAVLATAAALGVTPPP